MWGMYLGLDLTWKEHISHLIVESDSKILIWLSITKSVVRNPQFGSAHL
jgi:hypothetical protein